MVEKKQLQDSLIKGVTLPNGASDARKPLHSAFLITPISNHLLLPVYP